MPCIVASGARLRKRDPHLEGNHPGGCSVAPNVAHIGPQGTQRTQRNDRSGAELAGCFAFFGIFVVKNLVIVGTAGFVATTCRSWHNSALPFPVNLFPYR